MIAVPTILFLSPHSDDVALSCDGLVHLAASCNPCWIVTVFSESSHHADGATGDVSSVSCVRRNEDYAYARRHNLQLVDMALPDAPLRDTTVFRPFERSDDEQVSSLARSLRRILGSVQDYVLVAPLALGQHIDHIICLHAALKYGPSSKLVLYEDLPYALDYSRPAVESWVRAFSLENLQNVVLSWPRSRDEKREGLSLYRSQIRAHHVHQVLMEFPHALGCPAEDCAESYWITNDTLLANLLCQAGGPW